MALAVQVQPNTRNLNASDAIGYAFNSLKCAHVNSF